MAYSIIEEAGELVVSYDEQIDAVTLAVLDGQLHLIAEKVALHRLRQRKIVEKTRVGMQAARTVHGFAGRPPVRLLISGVQAGSLAQTFVLASSSALIDPLAREVLANVLSDIVAAVGKSVFARNWRHAGSGDVRLGPGVDVGSNVRAIVAAALDAAGERPVRLKLRVTRHGSCEECELDIRA